MDELYVLARRVLLDALEALDVHRDACVLVGAQAVYLRVGEAELAVAPYTEDGDLAIDPGVLKEIPPIEQALLGAKFRHKGNDSVGIWVTQRSTSQHSSVDVAVDLLVPASMDTGGGRRGAKLRGHDKRAARLVKGLEGALVDADILPIESFEEADHRAFELRVAGPAALLVSKVHKIEDRLGVAERLNDKDALDVLRLLRGTSTEALVGRFERVLADARSRDVGQAGLELLRRQFADRRATGAEMAARAVGTLGNADEITASCEALARDLLRALGLV